MEMIYAPDYIQVPSDQLTIFLAGSIEMGEAEDWQDAIGNEFTDYDVRLLNPRRPDWDSSWEQKIDNPQFRQQVEWELRGMELSDIIFCNFLPDTKSPITLMELGLHALSDQDIIVCCPEGFWRKGNVDIVCHKYGLQCVDSYDEAVQELHKRINKYNGSTETT